MKTRINKDAPVYTLGYMTCPTEGVIGILIDRSAVARVVLGVIGLRFLCIGGGGRFDLELGPSGPTIT